MSSFLTFLLLSSLLTAFASGSVIVKRQVVAKTDGSISVEGKGKLTFDGAFSLQANSQDLPSTEIASEARAETDEQPADRDLSVFLFGQSDNEALGQTDVQGANALAFILGLEPREVEDPSPKAAAVADADLENSRVSASIAVLGGIP